MIPTAIFALPVDDVSPTTRGTSSQISSSLVTYKSTPGSISPFHVLEIIIISVAVVDTGSGLVYPTGLGAPPGLVSTNESDAVVLVNNV